MAEGMPHPPVPEGFQRPGVPGAGNILDPKVRADLREQLHEAVQGAREQVQPGERPAEEAPPAQPAEQPAPPASSGGHRVGPFPHGDVDLSGLVANVIPNVRPHRGGRGRRFYFLAETPEEVNEGTTASPPRAPDRAPE